MLRLPPRYVLAGVLALTPLPAAAAVVINEVDYDQVGVDNAEFIELRNNGASAVDLGTYTLELVNGNDGLLYRTVTLPALSLAPGGYYVIGFGSANHWHADLVENVLDNSVQNGAPDAIGLRDGGVLVDAVSYEGDTIAPYTEGTGTVAADDNIQANVGLSRYPDGQDTDNNNADWSVRCITPGAPNSSGTGGCGSPTPVSNPTWGALKSLYR